MKILGCRCHGFSSFLLDSMPLMLNWIKSVDKFGPSGFHLFIYKLRDTKALIILKAQRD